MLSYYNNNCHTLPSLPWGQCSLKQVSVTTKWNSNWRAGRANSLSKMEQINCTTVVSPLHADQKIEETAEGRMVIRNVVDKEQQGKFDEWYNGKAYKITTASETRIGKPMNWDSRKSAQCWKFFSQGAMKTDGRPVVRCLICHQQEKIAIVCLRSLRSLA